MNVVFFFSSHDRVHLHLPTVNFEHRRDAITAISRCRTFRMGFEWIVTPKIAYSRFDSVAIWKMQYLFCCDWEFHWKIHSSERVRLQLSTGLFTGAMSTNPMAFFFRHSYRSEIDSVLRTSESPIAFHFHLRIPSTSETHFSLSVKCQMCFVACRGPWPNVWIQKTVQLNACATKKALSHIHSETRQESRNSFIAQTIVSIFQLCDFHFRHSFFATAPQLAQNTRQRRRRKSIERTWTRKSWPFFCCRSPRNRMFVPTGMVWVGDAFGQSLFFACTTIKEKRTYVGCRRMSFRRPHRSLFAHIFLFLCPWLITRYIAPSRKSIHKQKVCLMLFACRAICNWNCFGKQSLLWRHFHRQLLMPFWFCVVSHYHRAQGAR